MPYQYPDGTFCYRRLRHREKGWGSEGVKSRDGGYIYALWIQRAGQQGDYRFWYGSNALKEKTAEAIIIDKPVAQYFINKYHPDAVIAGAAFEKESYGIVMCRHGELTPKVNKALAELKNSGEYNKIYEKWFGKESN